MLPRRLRMSGSLGSALFVRAVNHSTLAGAISMFPCVA
jgi:hypothetical protein